MGTRAPSSLSEDETGALALVQVTLRAVGDDARTESAAGTTAVMVVALPHVKVRV
jgi:hypothetical protein